MSDSGRGVPVASRARDAPDGNLPAELTSFIGRTVELARVRELLSEVRLLTLSGAGGCGKTRLALQSAAAVLEQFPDGVWWVELAALEDPEPLASTVAGALGVRDRPGRTPLDVLCEHLRDRRALLVLDNCEHLLEPCASIVVALLGSCPGLVVLATSRGALEVPGELVYRVPSLSLPEASGSSAELSQSDAVALFLDRARHARRGFALHDDNALAIAAICRDLDGMPLAIELAAARVRMLSPERIAHELADRFRLLTGGGRSVALRHETLRASIDWSHELCSEHERILLRRLAVWTGGFTLEGAESVSGGGGLERRAALETLTGLVDKALVDTEERGGEIRFRMLDTIRQYAAARLAEVGEVEAVHGRHLEWCLELAERAEPELVRRDAATWVARLELEAPNLRAALDWAASRDVDAALRLAAALTFFWLVRGRLEEGTASLQRALAGAPEPSAVRGKVLWGLSYLSIYRGQFGACLAYADRALADGEAAGDASVTARALTAKALVLTVKNPVEGRAPVERSIQLALEAGDDWCRADAMRVLGGSYMQQSEHQSGRAIVEEAYALSRELGYRPHYGWYFKYRAVAELEHGRLPAAREFAEQGGAISRELREPLMLGAATAVLVECDVLEGSLKEARERGEPFIEFARDAGILPAQGWVQNALALADVAEGSMEAARDRVEDQLRRLEAAPAYDQITRARWSLALVLLLSGDTDGAVAEARLVLSQAEAGRNEYVGAIARYLLGRVALARGAVLEAEGHLHEALAIAARRDFRLQTLAALESLARVAALMESDAEAGRLLGAVGAARETLGVVRWPPERDLWAGVEEGVRSALGEDAFVAAEAEGAALSVDEAVEYAGHARGRRKRPSRGWESLTPTELEVVRHAAAGLTNPQIGERMFISRATVKAHLSHIFGKLGLSSRSELAAAAARRGGDN